LQDINKLGRFAIKLGLDGDLTIISIRSEEESKMPVALQSC